MSPPHSTRSVVPNIWAPTRTTPAATSLPAAAGGGKRRQVVIRS